MVPISLTKENNIATITLVRPEVFNSVNKELALSFQRFLDDCAADADVKVVVITGSGKAFCAGQDLGEIVDPNGPPIQEIVSKHFNPIVSKIRAIEKPIIAAVNGVAAGAGANIALACDIVIAKESASFLQAFSKINLIPDSGGTYTLPRLIGFQKASALMMLGEKISATEAERLGMIYKVVKDEDFDAEVEQIGKKICQLPTKGLALTKKALNVSYFNSFEDQLRIEDKLQAEAGSTEDYHEAVKAFVEKRNPVFKGK